MFVNMHILLGHNYVWHITTQKPVSMSLSYGVKDTHQHSGSKVPECERSRDQIPVESTRLSTSIYCGN